MKVEEFVDPYLGRTWGELGARILSSGDTVSVTLGYPALGYADELRAALAEHLGSANLDLELRFQAPAGRGFQQVKQIIAVASGKGGVGKSTTAPSLPLWWMRTSTGQARA